MWRVTRRDVKIAGSKPSSENGKWKTDKNGRFREVSKAKPQHIIAFIIVDPSPPLTSWCQALLSIHITWPQPFLVRNFGVVLICSEVQCAVWRLMWKTRLCASNYKAGLWTEQPSLLLFASVTVKLHIWVMKCARNTFGKLTFFLQLIIKTTLTFFHCKQTKMWLFTSLWESSFYALKLKNTNN